MSEDEYKASPYFRTDIPFDPGMTEDRAASLAAFYDQKKVREYFGSKRPISTFIGQFAGQALDPINYVPVFGVAAEAAAVARLGTIGGRLLVGASDAAINTAAFGVMSAGLREEFGDDVSWQAMTNEIAMSALIGGVFSGVASLVRGAWNATAGRSARAAEAKVANELLDIRSLKESRAVLNEAVGTLAETGDVSLSPNSAAIAERIATEVTGRAAAVRALDTQTANVNTAEAVAITPSGQRVNVRPEVVDASTLVRATGDLQVRNRSTAASNMQVEDIAINLDPARLMPSVDADSGAPIVGPDNIIDSGNGRVLAIVRASQAYPARYGAYRKALEDAGYDLTGIETPVLINRRTTELSREARALFNQEANAPRAAQMSAVELAAMDRNALEGTLDVLDASPITSAGNRAFVQRFMGNLTPSARGALVDVNGNINADGVRRIENALVASAYGDVDAAVLRRFAEATDDNTRAIVGAMSDVSGKWAQMRQSIRRGDISPGFDMTPELTEALRRIGQWREQAKRESRPVSVVIKEGMAQIDMLSGEISPEAQVMIGAFYQSNSFARAAGRETIADLLSRIVDATEELGRPQLFETADVGKLELLRNAAVNEQGNLFTPIGTSDGIEADGSLDRPVAPAADSQGGGQGSGRDGRQPVTPPPADGMVRMYHGGRADSVDFEGKTDFFSSDPVYAEGYARKNWGDEGAVFYVDVPRTDRIFDADYPEQSVDTGFTVQAELPANTASQRQRFVSVAEPELGLGDAKPARVTTSTLMPNDTVEVAAARVGKSEDIRQIALAHGVDPVTGDFVEAGDIEQLRFEGRLTAADEAELAAADAAFEDAQAWGRALDAAVSCIL